MPEALSQTDRIQVVAVAMIETCYKGQLDCFCGCGCVCVDVSMYGPLSGSVGIFQVRPHIIPKCLRHFPSQNDEGTMHHWLCRSLPLPSHAAYRKYMCTCAPHFEWIFGVEASWGGVCVMGMWVCACVMWRFKWA